jgi:hypothetical protein
MERLASFHKPIGSQTMTILPTCPRAKEVVRGPESSWTSRNKPLSFSSSRTTTISLGTWPKWVSTFSNIRRAPLINTKELKLEM